MKYDIFISYRREGGYDTAKHLNDLLVRDGYKVSFDIDTLRSGDFDKQLLTRIDECKDFILIVDAHAFDKTIDSNFDPQKDWLRCELAYALKQKKNIIPIFLSGVTGFPTDLPSDVADVVKKNGPEYNRYHFNAFYSDLKKRFLKSKRKGRFVGFAIVFVIVIFGGIALLMRNPNPPPSHPFGVHFYMQQNNDDFYYMDAKLHAIVDGVDHLVELNDDADIPLCIILEDTIDVDGDGDKEALITNVQACGGNGIGYCYFIVKYKGNGYFSVSENMGSNASNIEIETWNGQTSFVVLNTLPNHRQEKLRYVYENGQIKLVESLMLAYQSIENEIKSSDFHNGRENDTISLNYDLNSDGSIDTISCSYWERWDLMFVEIHWNNGTVQEYHTGFSRIGVLTSKTNGVFDIIADENTIIKWNGEKYIDPRDILE